MIPTDNIPHIIAKERADMLLIQWRNIDRIKRSLETDVQAAQESLFDDQVREVRSKLQQFRSYGVETRIDPILSVERVFNIGKWIQRTAERLSGWFIQAILKGFETGALKVDISATDVTSNDPAVREMLEMMINRSRYTDQTTSEMLAELIQQALEDGDSIDELSRKIQNMFDDMKPHRARLVATTNVTAGFERGQLESYKRAGIEFKMWLSERDKRVRDSHAVGTGADSQIVPVDSPFRVGMALLQHPGDPVGGEGNLSEIMNCRCTMLPRKTGEQTQ